MVSTTVRSRLLDLGLLPAESRARRRLAGVLAGVGLLAVLLAWWPLRLAGEGSGRAPAVSTENVSWRSGDDPSWRNRSLRAPLGQLDSQATDPYALDDEGYLGDDSAEADPVLVGLSYRSAGESLAFIRFAVGVVRVLGVGEEHQGLRLTVLERDHVVVDHGEGPRRLGRLGADDPAPAPHAAPGGQAASPPLPRGDTF